MRFLKWTPKKAGMLAITATTLVWYSFGMEKPLLLTAIDNRIHDEMFRIRGASHTSGEVVIVDIDEKSLAALGQWPWPRDEITRLLTAIHKAGPKATGFDMVFAERDRTTPAVYMEKNPHLFKDRKTWTALTPLWQSPSMDHDISLGKAMALGKTVAGYAFAFDDTPALASPFPSVSLRLDPATLDWSDLPLASAKRPILNIPEVSTSASEGFFNVFPDPSGTVRQVPLLMAMGQIPYPSLALEMYRLGQDATSVTVRATLLKKQVKSPISGLFIGTQFIPTDHRAQITVNFRGPAHTFAYVSAKDVMNRKATNRLHQKYVLVGSSAAGIMDFVATPFSPVFPGVEVHATVIDNLLQKDPLVYDALTESGATYALLVGGGLLMLLLLTGLPPLAGSASAFVVLFGMGAGNYLLFFQKNHLVGLSYPIFSLFLIFLVVTLANSFPEGVHRQFIKNAFSLYVSPSVVGQLIKNPKRLALSVERRRVTIFFSDIRGFTALSEKLPPEELGAFMNAYLTVVSDTVMAHGGMVDKYIGDAVMAVWGTPLQDKNQALHAVSAALEVKKKLASFVSSWSFQGPDAHTGMGLNTGWVSAGNFGSKKRFDYTVLGDAVNLASRLEGLTKIYGVDIIISESTKKEIEEKVFCRRLDTVRVKGKTEPTSIYEPICLAEPSASIKEEVKRFHNGLDLFGQRSFSDALKEIEALQTQNPSPLYEHYIGRIDHCLTHPPGPLWSPIHTLKSK